uniref:Uncharacterized protein n=1 Tax=Arundo donax TaxID=35708 RepID=A0A0A9TDN6_ARUDO
MSFQFLKSSSCETLRIVWR